VTTRLRGAFADMAGEARIYTDSHAALRRVGKFRQRTAVAATAIVALLTVLTLNVVLPDLGGRLNSGDPVPCGSANPGGDPSTGFWPDPGASGSPGYTPDPSPEASTSPGYTPDPSPETSTSPGYTPDPNPQSSTSPGYTPDPSPETSTSPGYTADPNPETSTSSDGSLDPSRDTSTPNPGYPSPDGVTFWPSDSVTQPYLTCQPHVITPPTRPVMLPDSPVGDAAFVYQPCADGACDVFAVLSDGKQFRLPGSRADIESYTISPDWRLIGLSRAGG